MKRKKRRNKEDRVKRDQYEEIRGISGIRRDEAEMKT